jgi:hypothetical protein
MEKSPSESAEYFTIDVLSGNVLEELLAVSIIPETASPIGFRVIRDIRDSSQIHVEILCSSPGATESQMCAMCVKVERLPNNPSHLLRKILEKFIMP